ncbi:tetratricopeptide repeat protein [Jeotgalibacillus campisalis]|uniref:Tetratricopeptide repeat protein n=1 Tax=Jeotgalibacillus campisalis TaxID=220754 RepID=A0A0C2R7K8_9BACL|nr:tetratricopeptide repeat protein [Jeotgalibacillus campisalis]KIL46240.1 hypothetical protein KR50_29150 [Jeotgalibacillus campisalis]
MAKRPGKKKSNDQKVVPFPQLKDRLVEKGLEKLQEQHHAEAIQLLKDAYALDQEDSVTLTSLAVALYEDHNWTESKELCEKMLHEGIGDYEETLELYIMNLFQLKEHESIAETIHTVLDEGVLSLERRDRFEHLLSISHKQDQQVQREDTSFQSFSLQKDLEQQMVQVANLSKQNIHPIKDSLIEVIQVKETHPFIKTMLLNILREQGIQDDILVEKWGRKTLVNPSELKEPFESDRFEEVLMRIQNQAGHEDPNLVELAIDLMRRHLFLLYPYSWAEQDPAIIAIAYLHLGERYMGLEMEWNEDETDGIADEIETLEMVPII